MVQAKVGLTNFGTAALVGPISAVGGLPTRNYSMGNLEGEDKINGAVLAETAKSRGGRTGHACSPGCVIRCSNIYTDQEGKYLTAGLEFETIVLMGSNLGTDSLDVIAALDRRCDDYGLDTMEMGNAIGVAMEARMASFGDGNVAVKLLDEVAAGTERGCVLGQGATTTGRVLGVSHVAAVKGQGMAAYDPRALKGTVVSRNLKRLSKNEPPQQAAGCLRQQGTKQASGNLPRVIKRRKNMKKEIIDIPGVAKLKQLSRAVKFGSTVYVAGTIGKPMKGGEMCSDITNQAKIAMENLKMVLENAGTSIENVLKMTCYLKDMKDKADFDKIFILYFPKDPPARACFAVRDLGEGIKLEIETIASIPD